jgi:hypothetical protein
VNVIRIVSKHHRCRRVYISKSHIRPNNIDAFFSFFFLFSAKSLYACEYITAVLQDALRHIIITENREIALTKALDFLTNDKIQDAAFLKAKNGRAIVTELSAEVERVMDYTEVKEQFDYLVTLTFALVTYGQWIYDSDSLTGCERVAELAVQDLAVAWKRLLKSSLDELGIDSVDSYTMRGTIALLHKLENRCNDFSQTLQFHWK